MEREELRIDSARFDAVWERVCADRDKNCGCGTAIMPVAAAIPVTAAELCGCTVGISERAMKPIGGEVEAMELRKLMDITAEIMCDCRCLAARCSGRVSRTPACIAEDERRHMKKLRAQYYILTGCAYLPEGKCEPACTVSEALRRLYADITIAEAAFSAAAESARPDIRNTYLCYARDEQRHAEAVENLVERMMC